jgi:hypothetical protein
MCSPCPPCTRSGRRKRMNMVEFYLPRRNRRVRARVCRSPAGGLHGNLRRRRRNRERMDAGRKALMQRGDNEVGPYQSPMEDGMQHFHEWYRAWNHYQFNSCSRIARARSHLIYFLPDASTLDGSGLRFCSPPWGSASRSRRRASTRAELVFYRGIVSMIFMGVLMRAATAPPAHRRWSPCRPGAA